MSLLPCPDYIGGAWLDRKDGTPLFNPSTGDVIAACPASSD